MWKLVKFVEIWNYLGGNEYVEREKAAVYAAVQPACYFDADLDCRQNRTGLDEQCGADPAGFLVHYGCYFVALPLLQQETARTAQQGRGSLQALRQRFDGRRLRF